MRAIVEGDLFLSAHFFFFFFFLFFFLFFFFLFSFFFFLFSFFFFFFFFFFFLSSFSHPESYLKIFRFFFGKSSVSGERGAGEAPGGPRREKSKTNEKRKEWK